MSNFIRTTLAATASVGALALPIGGAHAATAPATATTSAATTASTSTTTSTSTAVAPSVKPRLTKHERKVRREKRAARREHRRAVRRNHHVDRALAVAARQQGDPYRYGATGPNAFDCSGLMLYSFRAAGLHLPRTSAAQAGAVRHISRAKMRRGDLVFFTSGGHVYHVGIFDGWRHGRRVIIHAPHTGTSVRKEAIWTNSWFPGTMRLA